MGRGEIGNGFYEVVRTLSPLIPGGVLPPDVEVERVQPVLVDLEDGDLGQVADRVRKVLDGVLAQVKVRQVGLKV